MHRFVGFGLLFIRLVLPHGAGAADAVTADSVPFRFDDQLITVEVVVEGRDEPLNFVLDSGAGVTVVDVRRARELGLRFGKRTIVRGIQGSASARHLRGFAAEIGGQSLPDSPLALDLSGIGDAGRESIDGLIGADFLCQHKVQIDYVSKTVRFDGNCRVSGERAREVKLQRRNDAWCAPVRIAHGRREWMRIDTGYDGAVAWHPGKGIEKSMDRGATLALSRAAGREVGAPIKVGLMKIRRARVSLLSSPAFPGEAGMIGNGLLSRHRVTLDLKRNRLILEPLD